VWLKLSRPWIWEFEELCAEVGSVSAKKNGSKGRDWVSGITLPRAAARGVLAQVAAAVACRRLGEQSLI
jgi:hypothetical protein